MPIQLQSAARMRRKGIIAGSMVSLKNGQRCRVVSTDYTRGAVTVDFIVRGQVTHRGTVNFDDVQ